MLRLNSIFKLFEPAPAQKSKSSGHLRIQTVYGAAPAAAPHQNLWHARPVDKSVLARQKETLSKQSRYSSIEEVMLTKNTLLVGFGYPAEYVFTFSFNIYYSAKEWDGLKKQAASRKTGIACYQPKHDEVACLKLVKPGHSKVCSYLIDSKAIEINPTRGWLVLPPDLEAVCNDNPGNRLKK